MLDGILETVHVLNYLYVKLVTHVIAHLDTRLNEMERYGKPGRQRVLLQMSFLVLK